MQKVVVVGGITLAVILIGLVVFWRGSSPSNPLGVREKPLSGSEEVGSVETIAEGLAIPWEIVFLPDGAMLVTERDGQLLKLGEDKTVIPIEGVQHVGEGGLLGLALHPQFSRNQFIYLYLTTQQGEGLKNRVERYRLAGGTLSDRTVIIENIPGARIHDGGRIAFGVDDKLYITTGDAGAEDNAQDLNSLAGKILRLNDDGSIPSDNPFGTPVYSYGHRNPQGLAWDKAGRLWATEHGRSGVQSGFDEVNLIKPGQNYGWPVIEGDEERAGLEPPAVHSGAATTWAPAGAAIVDNRLFFTGLRGETLYEAVLEDEQIVELKEHFAGEFGRLRVVTQGPDGALYLATSNRDGRGNPVSNDDKIIRVNLPL